MGLFLLFSLAAGSAALLGVINLFDGNSAIPEASAEEIALLEGDAITATEQMLADDPTRGEDIEALDLTPSQQNTTNTMSISQPRPGTI